MDLNNSTDKFLASRGVRRYPDQLHQVPSRDPANNIELKNSARFSEAATAAHRAAQLQAKAIEPPAKQFALWEKGGAFGFGDFIDIINPLQHIPILATVYRNYTGDQIGAAPRVIGGALWGRIGGLVTGLANVVVEWWSGKDIGDHVYAALFGTPNKEPNASALAQEKLPSSAPVNGAAVPAARKSGGPPLADSAESHSSAFGAADPHAPRSEEVPMTRAARSSYERNRKWGERDESLGVRFPA